MAIEIFMPALSPTMEKGSLAKWLVAEGDEVASGDVICEIETDKATMEVESIDDGIVAKILVADGTDDVAVGTLIAILAEEGEDVADIKVPSAKPSKAPVAAKEDAPEVVEAAPAPKATAAAPSPEPASNASSDRVKASPLAKRMAEQGGLNLSTLTGSGPHGRIVKADVEAALAAPQGSTRSAQTAAPAVTGDNSFRDEKLSNMRKTIARRLTESKQNVPHFYLTIDCRLDRLMAVRKEVNDGLAESGQKVSVNDFIIKAAGLALKKVPAANAQFHGDIIRYFDRADISMAVAIEGGLITPVIRGACGKSLTAIASDAKTLAGKARDGKLMPEEYTNGTFSISNLGMMGIKEFSAVINPPEGAILAIGAGTQQPVVGDDGTLSVGTVMSCTLSCDHRVIDGAVGAEFLKAFKGFIENPLTMLV